MVAGLAQITSLINDENINNIDIVDHILRIGVKECETYLTSIPKQIMTIAYNRELLLDRFELFFEINKRKSELIKKWNYINSIIKVDNVNFDFDTLFSFYHVQVMDQITNNIYLNINNCDKYTFTNVFMLCIEIQKGLLLNYISENYLHILVNLFKNNNINDANKASLLNKYFKLSKTEHVLIFENIITTYWNYNISLNDIIIRIL